MARDLHQTRRWEPVEGSFSRNFVSETPHTIPKIPIVAAELIRFPAAIERVIAAISQRHVQDGSACAAALKQVKGTCVAESAPDYSKDAGAFFNLYFDKNMRKAASVIASEPQLCAGDTVRILDLGSGSGASIIGVINALLNRRNPPKHIFVDLVERSPEQNALASEILGAWIAESKLKVSFRIFQADAIDVVRAISQRLDSFESTDTQDQYDLIVSSYFVTELTGKAAAELAVELQFLEMSAELPPALLFMGSYASGNHFGYYLYNPALGNPDFCVLEAIWKAVGLKESHSE